MPPYTNWADAATNIQDAISACSAADVVVVSNGVYQTGGVTNWPAGTLLTNRVAITNTITVRAFSTNPAVTVIKGAWDPATNGPAAVRCVYMIDGSSLIGFTLTNGATLTTGVNDSYGGGILSQSVSGTISNCVITGNSAVFGGGALYGTLYNCTLTRNSAPNAGGANSATLSNCTLSGNSATYGGAVNGCILYNCTLSSNSATDGGGTYSTTMYNCTLTGNSATSGGGSIYSTLYNCTLTGNSATYGGGVYGGTLYNCTIVSNSASSTGGGAYNSTLYNCSFSGNSAWVGGGTAYGTVYNCTISGNSALLNVGGSYAATLFNCTIIGNSAVGSGGGAYDGTYINSIIYFNSAPDGSNWAGAAVFTNSCTTTAAVGWASGNITSDPLFIDPGSGYGTNHVPGNYRLRGNSPCINAGTNFAWMTNTNDVRSADLDGNPRIRYGTVDMGAYETLLRGTTFTLY